jgi:hypothetical protein
MLDITSPPVMRHTRSLLSLSMVSISLALCALDHTNILEVKWLLGLLTLVCKLMRRHLYEANVAQNPQTPHMQRWIAIHNTLYRTS